MIGARLVGQIRDIPLLLRHPRRYVTTRTAAVRNLYWYGFVASRAAKFLHRRRMLKALPVSANLPGIPIDDGHLRIQFLDPLLVQEVMTEARAAMGAVNLQEMEAVSGSKHLLEIPIEKYLAPGSAIWRLSMNPSLLRVVGDYIGMLPVIQNIHLLYSPNKQNVLDTSQFFHLDGQDRRTVKVWVFIEDIAEENGPLTLVDAVESRRLASFRRYRKAGKERRMKDETVFKFVKPSSIHRLTGPAGSVTMFDGDRCFHYGSRQSSRPRLVLAVDYFSPFAFVLPWDWRKAMPFTRVAHPEQLPEVEQYVLGLT